MSTFPVNGLSVDLDLSGYATKEDLQTISLTPGPKGDNGVDGKQGIQGEHGERGDIGPQGPAGERGEKGDTGAQGPQGEQGPPGQVITVDHEGKQGVEGPVGPRGEKGDKGDTGEVGPMGPQGVEGPQGPRGAQGEHGADGVAGAKGDKGDAGVQGPKGDAGAPGAKGDTGAPGAGTQAQLDDLLRQINELNAKVASCCDNKDTKITVIEKSETGAQIILNLDSRNINSLPRNSAPGKWYDLTSNHNDATVFGTVAYGSLGGQYCAVFPGGAANYVQVLSREYFKGGAFTVQSWVYVTKVDNWNRIIDFGNGVGVQCIVLSNSYGTSGNPGLYMESQALQMKAKVAAPLNQWNHICTTFVPNTNPDNKPVVNNTATDTAKGVAKIFINGVLQGATYMPKPTNVVRKNCYIGKSNWPPTQDPNMTGGIGAVQIYDGALTDAEILANYNTTKSYYVTAPIQPPMPIAPAATPATTTTTSAGYPGVSSYSSAPIPMSMSSSGSVSAPAPAQLDSSVAAAGYINL